MHLITRLTAAFASFTLIGAMWTFPETANSKEPDCVTWSEKKSEIQSLFNQHYGYNRPLPELPNGFKSGCIFGDSGSFGIAIFVLKDGLRPRAVKNNDTVFRTSIPLFPSVDVGDANMDNGDILLFTSVCNSQGTAWFCEDVPKDRPYIKNGLVCLENLCLRANSVPNTELLRLWAATLKPMQW
jgi:hypothetical protein